MFGITAGYDWQRGNIVYGIAGDLLFGEMNGNAPTAASYNCGALGCELNVSSVAMLRGRVGYAVSDQLLPYVTMGVAVTQLNVDAPTFPPSADDTATNLVVGLGADYMVTDNIALGFDYLHLLERTERIGEAQGGTGIFGATNFSGDIIRLNVMYRF